MGGKVPDARPGTLRVALVTTPPTNSAPNRSAHGQSESSFRLVYYNETRRGGIELRNPAHEVGTWVETVT